MVCECYFNEAYYVSPIEWKPHFEISNRKIKIPPHRAGPETPDAAERRGGQKSLTCPRRREPREPVGIQNFRGPT
jgi:hypothetical protein